MTSVVDMENHISLALKCTSALQLPAWNFQVEYNTTAFCIDSEQQ